MTSPSPPRTELRGLKRLLEPLVTVRRVFPILWAAAPTLTVLASALMLIEITFGLAVLYLIKSLVDALTGLMGSEAVDAALADTLWIVALTALCSVVFLACRGFAALAREAQGFAVSDHVNRLIHAQAVRADLAFYESPAYFDTLQRARQSGAQRPAQVAANVLMTFKSAILLAGIVVLIATINAWLLVLIGLAILPALLIRLYFTRMQYDWQKGRVQLERRASYFDWLLTSDVHAKELRLNRLGQFLSDSYSSIRRIIRAERVAILRRKTLTELGAGVVVTLAFFGALGFLVVEAVAGHSTIGDLVLFFLIFQRAQSTGQELVSQISRLYEDHLYLGLVFDFLDIRPAIASGQGKPIPPESPGLIEIRNVSFRYPGTDRYVLRNINLEISPGQVVALVGGNGSGKTSLIKLLCRLYDPTEGAIFFDGRDIREIELSSWRRRFSVIFQDYSRYFASIEENIRYGNIEMSHSREDVVKAAQVAEADEFIRAMPKQYDTVLGRMFDDGHEISIGQWQKIALARAFLPDSSCIVLDEPTSALDPRSEFELFDSFRRRIGDRSAVVISHRLSTVRMAEAIHVLDDGEIKEAGTHDELMATGGEYQRAFTMQGRYYQPNQTVDLADVVDQK